MSKFQALLFDLDGTLIDSREDLSNAVNFALSSTGQPVQPPEDILPHVGNGLKTLLSQVMGPVSDQILQKGIESFSFYYGDHCVDSTRLYEGVAEGLRGMKSSFRLGVVTNKPFQFAEKIIRMLKVGDVMDIIIGGDTLPQKKPHPAPVLKALEKMGTPVEQALFVGDGAQDILSGQAAGVQTCIAKYGYGFRPDFLDLKPNFHIEDFAQLKEIVL